MKIDYKLQFFLKKKKKKKFKKPILKGKKKIVTELCNHEVMSTLLNVKPNWAIPILMRAESQGQLRRVILENKEQITCFHILFFKIKEIKKEI